MTRTARLRRGLRWLLARMLGRWIFRSPMGTWTVYCWGCGSISFDHYWSGRQQARCLSPRCDPTRPFGGDLVPQSRWKSRAYKGEFAWTMTDPPDRGLYGDKVRTP